MDMNVNFILLGVLGVIAYFITRIREKGGRT